MSSTLASLRDVFRQIAQRPYITWPAYDSTPLYDRTSLAGLESDVRVVAETWFDHESHHSVEEFVHIDNVLMDREFDSQHVLEMLSQRGLSYVVPKRMQTSEKAQAKRLLQRGQNRYETDRKLHLGKNEWHETTLIYRRKEDSEHDDHWQYSVFMSNCGSGHLTEYGYR